MKKLLICLTVLFSVFLFNNKVSAEENLDNIIFAGDEYGIVKNFTKDSLGSIVKHNNIDTSIYNMIAITNYSYFYNNKYSSGFGLFFYNKDDYDNGFINLPGEPTFTLGTSSYFGNNENSNYNFYYLNHYSIIETTDTYYTHDLSTYDFTQFNLRQTTIGTSTSTYTYGILYNGYIGDIDLSDSYNITFHLNGGKVFDSNEICNEMSCYILGNKYDDYTTNIGKNDLLKYLTNQEVSKETMQFVGWYYDEKLTQKVNGTDILDSDKHFYAKYQYKNVEDFLNNTTFNSYTFDENYQYAIITLNNQSNRDIYLGLDIMSHNLEVYKYNKVNLSYEKGANLCLTPIFSKNNKYYYQVSDSLDNEYEVLIIPKEKLKGNYNFLLSDNAYVSYTNDLKNVVIKDENGNDLNTDLENSYDYSQDNLLNNENDLLEIFKDLINNKDNNVFSYFNQIWNYMKQNKLFIYFMSLIVGALIILIIKAASR